MTLTIIVTAPVAPATHWSASIFDGEIPMGGWNLSAEQAADDHLLLAEAAKSYPAYTHYEVSR